MTSRTFRLFARLALTVGTAVFATSSFAADSPKSDPFAELHALIKPRGAEQKWEQIPWLTSLWEARQKAAREGKPILLWEMDGHPLGCT